MPDEMLRDWDTLFATASADFFALARERGRLVYPAHPFHNGMKITDPAPLFGIEAHNMHLRYDSRNNIAEARARRFVGEAVVVPRTEGCVSVEKPQPAASTSARTFGTGFPQAVREGDVFRSGGGVGRSVA